MHEKQNKTAELEIYVMETVNSTLKMAEKIELVKQKTDLAGSRQETGSTQLF